LFDDLPSDEEDDTSPECNVNPEPQGAGPDTQQLLSSMLEKLDVMNSNVTAIGTRVGELEKSNKKSTKKPSKLTLAGLDSGLRSRMQALDIRVNEEDSDSEDQWEVAGAGAANPVKDKPDKTGKKLVSGAVLASQDDVLVQFDFPHKHVPITVARPKPTALDLTLPEFIYGYTDMMRDRELDQETRFQMMDLLIILMDDAFTRPWPSVRHFHLTVIQAMEHGKLQWGDTVRIENLQRQHSWPGAAGTSRISNATRTVNGGFNRDPLFCRPFQSNTCDRTTDHQSPRGFVQHICSYCWRIVSRPISSHGEIDCRRKRNAEAPKNAE
jgi:hypothetical protein